MKTRYIVMLAAVLTAAAAAQEIPSNLSLQDSVLVEIGPKKVTVREFLASYEFGPGYTKRHKDSKDYHLDLMINEKLLALDGMKKGLLDSKAFNEPFSEMQSDIMTEQLYRHKIMPRVAISEDELNSALKRKNTEISFRWIFSDNKEEIGSIYKSLKTGAGFDSLFNLQLNDSVFADERGMTIDKFKLWQKNPLLDNTVDSLKAGAVSRPVQGQDGWYIVKIDSVSNLLELSESEMSNKAGEVKTALKKRKMDILSDVYVDSLIKSSAPVIDGKAYHIIRTYIGHYELDSTRFKEWDLERLAQRSVDELAGGDRNKIGGLSLVKYRNGSLTVADFLDWYRRRVDYLKFNRKDKKEFSAEVEGLVWRILRDKLLIAEALKDKMDDKPETVEQMNWWKDKILFALVRDELKSSVVMKGGKEIAPNLNPEMEKEYSQDVTNIIYRKIIQLKKQYPVKVNKALLKRIYVQEENNPKAVDMYFVKKGGIYPHPAFPTIDLFWQVF